MIKMGFVLLERALIYAYSKRLELRIALAKENPSEDDGSQVPLLQGGNPSHAMVLETVITGVSPSM
jgi:hypothetical protein